MASAFTAMCKILKSVIFSHGWFYLKLNQHQTKKICFFKNKKIKKKNTPN